MVGFWAIVFILLFAFVYWCFDLVKHSGDGTTHGFDWIYFSVVTFTTLGYGDFVPVGFVGQLIVCSEVLVAYVMLGLLVAVAAARFARLN